MASFRIGLPARLSAASIAQLERAFDEAKASDARVWVLEGDEPGAFCRGMDLSSVASAEDGRVAVEAFARCIGRLAHAPRPTIAVIDGEALGGGVGIAAACDLTLASSASSVGLPEALFGILPAMIMPALLSRMTQQRTRLLSLTCTSEPADWAQRAGLFDRVVEPEKLERAKKRAIRDLSRVNSAAVPKLRRLIDTVGAAPFDAALSSATEVAVDMVADPDVQRTVALFLEEGIAPWAN